MADQKNQTVRQRRDILTSTPAPVPHHDVVVILECACMRANLRIRYVPDRDILTPESLTRYVEALAQMTFASHEETAQLILEDITDQVIPSWLEVTLSQHDTHMRHEVRIEDRQPNWKDRGLIDRLAP